MPAPSATTPKPTTKRPRQPKAEHLGMVYPELPKTNDRLFWLAHYLRNAAEESSLNHLAQKICSKADAITRMALAGSQIQAIQTTRISAKYTLDAGLLLYAWPGTTVFDTARQ